MNWENLRLFLVVSRYPQLEVAARQAGVDPTTISRRLKQLEKDLGLTLFERTRRGHTLTAAGETLVSGVEAMETASLDIEAFSDARSSGVSGKLRVGVPEGLGTGLIAPNLHGFHTRYPGVELDLIAQSGFVSVPRREADMSIMLTRPTTGRLRVRKLSDYTLHLYANPKLLGDVAVLESIEELKEKTLIGYVDDMIYDSQLRYYDEILPGLRPTFCSSSIVAQLEMTRSGCGLAILPDFLASTESDLVRVFETKISVKRSFWLAIHEDVYQFARTRYFVDSVVELMESKQEVLIIE